MPITGVAPGASGTFAATPLPAGAALPAGTTPTWSADNPLVTLTPVASDTTGLSVVAALDPTITGTSFNLTVSASFTGQDGTVKTPTTTASVPITGGTPPPPPPAEVTGFDIEQTA